MFSAVHDRIVYGFEYLKRVLCVVVSAHDCRVEAGPIACMACGADLFNFRQQCVFVAVDGQ